MQMVSLNSIYDCIAATEHTNVRSARNRYSASLEERPVYAQSPFKFVAGDKSQKSYGRQCIKKCRKTPLLLDGRVE